MLPQADCFVEFPRRDFPRLTHFGVVHHSTIGEVAPHHHPGYEIKYFFEGQGKLRVRGDRVIDIGENDILVTAPETEHGFLLRGKDVSFYWLGFQTGASVRADRTIAMGRSARRHATVDNSFLAQLDGGAAELAQSVVVEGYVVLRQFPEAHDVFRALAEELRQGRAYSRQMIYLKVMELFTLVARRLSDGAPGNPAMERIRRYLESNFDTVVSLQKLSQISGLSPAHISRRFKKVFGASPVTWLTRHRIEQAKVMLAAGDTVTRTARRCGFKDMHYFSSLFHKHAGVPPSTYAIRSIKVRQRVTKKPYS